MKQILYYKKQDFKKNLLHSIRKKIFKEKKAIVFRNLYSGKIDKILKKAQNYTQKNPKFFRPYIGCKDLYIFNKDIKKSKVRGYYKKVLLYPWNKKNIKFFKIFQKAFELKSFIDNNQINSKNNFYDNKKTLVIQIMNYPLKKGYLSKHRDSTNNSGCIMQICTSDKTQKKKVV